MTTISAILLSLGGCAMIYAFGFLSGSTYRRKAEKRKIGLCDTCEHLEVKSDKDDYFRYRCGCRSCHESIFKNPKEYCKHYEKRAESEET